MNTNDVYLFITKLTIDGMTNLERYYNNTKIEENENVETICEACCHMFGFDKLNTSTQDQYASRQVFTLNVY